jgi:hypothetical protein
MSQNEPAQKQKPPTIAGQLRLPQACAALEVMAE